MIRALMLGAAAVWATLAWWSIAAVVLALAMATAPAWLTLLAVRSLLPER